MPPSYHEYRPCRLLAEFVECYWSRQSRANGAPAPLNRVLPDGCMDIVFNFGDSWRGAGANGGRDGRRGGVVVGTMTAPLLIQPGRCEDFFGVRFRPGRASAFFGLPASECTDASVELAEVWGREAAGVEEWLATLPTAGARVVAMERELLRRLARAADATDRRVDAAVSFVVRHGGVVAVSAAADYAGLTRQHLARQFERYVGIAPKLFSRVVRFQHLLARIHGPGAIPNGERNWSSLALDAGYYDQSHLIADFRQFAGLTPEAYCGRAGQ